MEMEPLITAGAAVALSVAGFFMSNQRSRPNANLRSTRSESDLRNIGDHAAMAAALQNSKGAAPAGPTNGPKVLRRGLRIVSIDDAHSNVLQRISITPPSLPTLLEEPEDEEEGKEQQNNEIETEKNNNLEKEKEMNSPQMLAHNLLNGGEETITNKPNSLFPRKIHKTETETMKSPHMFAQKLLKGEGEEVMSNKLNSLFPTRDRQPKKEPETKIEQERSNVVDKNQVIKCPQMLVRDLLEKEELEKEEELEREEEEEIKCLHVLPQTLEETKEEIISIYPPNTEQPKNNTTPKAEQEKSDDLEKEKEIERLRALAGTLLERERDLEMQMLQYYGLKEQQEAMKEMENRLKTNSSEAKFLSVKVESLEEENERLKNQILELEKATNKLDKNKEKINMLKMRLRSEDDNAKEKIALLRERIGTLADKKEKSAADYEEMERKLERVNELEDEVNELKTLNARLEEENCGLAHRLENVQFVASSAMRGPEDQVLEEATRLREMNEKLEEEIGQLKTDHCSSVEEVVYLRWLNACLRHEMKNFNPSKDKMVASEVNKSPSYHSREKVKQLLQDYSNLGIDINETNLVDLDLDSAFSSQAPSTLTSPTSRHNGKHSKNKAQKIFGKFKKIVTGKTNSSADKDKDKDRMSLLASDNASVSCSDESSPSSSISTAERFPRSENHLRASLNIQRHKSVEIESARSNSDLGSPNIVRGEPRRYQALHLDRSSIDIDDRESEKIKKLELALNSSKPSGRR